MTEFNGRVDIIGKEPKSFNLYQECKPGNETFKQEAVRGHFAANPLSDIYFSEQNIDALQEAIRFQVWLRSGKKHTIGRQSDIELQVVMRSVYLQYARNLPFDVLGQVRQLNKMVLDYTVPTIVKELEQFDYYSKDISTLPVPMERSRNVSNAGTKFLYTREF
jgi:hypothetical protein